jgi:hypothetical protein
MAPRTAATARPARLPGTRVAAPATDLVVGDADALDLLAAEEADSWTEEAALEAAPEAAEDTEEAAEDAEEAALEAAEDAEERIELTIAPGPLVVELEGTAATVVVVLPPGAAGVQDGWPAEVPEKNSR